MKYLKYPDGGSATSPMFPLMQLLSLFQGENKINEPIGSLGSSYTKASVNEGVLNSLFSSKAADVNKVFYKDTEDSIPLTEGHLRGAKIQKTLLNDVKKVSEKYGVDPLDILAIAGKESTFGYGSFGSGRRSNGEIGQQDLFTYNDASKKNNAKTFLQYLYENKGDKRIAVDKNFHGIDFILKDDVKFEDVFADDKLVNEYKAYISKIQKPKEVNILEEVAKRIKTKGIGSYNPGQKNYVEMVDKYKQMLKNNKTPIFNDGGAVTPLNFVFPTTGLTGVKNEGVNSYFTDPMMLPEASLGGFFKKLGNSILGGFGAVGDQTLSLFGMPNVIKNSLYDKGVEKNPWMGKLNNAVGGALQTGLSAFLPGVGTGLNLLSGAVNSIGSNSMPSNFGGFNPLGSFNEPDYFSGSLLSGLLPNFGSGSTAPSLGGIGAGVNPLQALLARLGSTPPTFEEGGQVQQQMVPIQTEKDEKLIHLDFGITDTHANRKHEKMDDDIVSDVVPEGTYVASNDKSIKMTKKQADEIVMGIKIPQYKEGEKGSMPEKTLFSELFGSSKKLTPAELAEKIAKKFPTVDKSNDTTPNDVFTKATNKENINSRIPWLQELIKFNEEKRTKKEDPAMFKKGGEVRMKDLQMQDIKKHDWGDFASILGTAAPFLQGLFGKNQTGLDPTTRNLLLGSMPLNQLGTVQNINAQKSALGTGINDFTKLGQNLNQYAVGSTGMNVLGRLMQDTSFERFNPLTQMSALDNFQTRTPQSFVDALSTPKYDLNSLAATLGPRGFSTFASQLTGNQIDSRNKAMMDIYNQDRSLSYDVLGKKNALDSFTQQFNIGQGEKQMAAKNAQTAGVFGDFSSLFNRFGDIQSQILPITTQMNLQRAGLAGQANIGAAQNMMNVASIMSALQGGSNNQNGGNQQLIQQLLQKLLPANQQLQGVKNNVSSQNLNQNKLDLINLAKILQKPLSNVNISPLSKQDPDCYNGFSITTGMPCQ